METNIKEQKQKKGFWAVLWEAMTKTGGCCGGGENCCGPSQPDNGNAKIKESHNDLKTGNATK
jgi:hypothetical protein